MSSYSDLGTAATSIDTAMSTLAAKRTALEAKEPLVLAVLTAEQAAIDSATAEYNAARDIARTSTGWTAAKAELVAAEAAYLTAKENFDSVVSGLTPLEAPEPREE